MVVIHRAHGFRFVIYTADHEPAHVHITGPGRRRSIWSVPTVSPNWCHYVGIKHTEMRRLMNEVEARRDEFLAEWERIHGKSD